MSVVRFVRLHADVAGESHMTPEELGIKPSAFAPPAPPLGVSTMEPAAGWRFLHLPSGWVGEWHPSPKRMWIFCLKGDMEFQASDGTVLQVNPGSAMLLEDTSGKGHRSRVICDRDALRDHRDGIAATTGATWSAGLSRQARPPAESPSNIARPLPSSRRRVSATFATFAFIWM